MSEQSHHSTEGGSVRQSGRTRAWRLVADWQSQNAMAHVATGLTLALVVALGSAAASGHPVVLAAGLLMAVGATLVARTFGARPAVVAISLLIVPPGVVGENSAIAAAAFFGLMIVVIATTPAEKATRPWVEVSLLVAEALAFLSVGFLRDSRPSIAIAATYLLCAACLFQGAARPRLVFRSLAVFTLFIAFLCASYWVSLLSGFRFGPYRVLLKYRRLDIYLPFTVTSGSGGYWPSLPRLTLYTGEPGLGGVVLFVAAAVAVFALRGSLRVAVLLLLLSGLAFAQSTAAVLALSGSVAVAGTWFLLKRTTPLIAGIFLACAVPLLSWSTSRVLADKVLTNAQSIGDRGLLGSASYAGAISILAAFHVSLVTAVPIAILIMFLAARSARDPILLWMVVAVGAVAVFAQPLQMYAGMWLLLALAIHVRRHAASHSGPISLLPSSQQHTDRRSL